MNEMITQIRLLLVDLCLRSAMILCPSDRPESMALERAMEIYLRAVIKTPEMREVLRKHPELATRAREVGLE